MKNDKIKQMTRKYPKFILFFLILFLVVGGIFYFSDNQVEKDTLTQTAPYLKLLNSHSHPQTGENWVVSFETRGPVDLTITPEDKDSIGDLDFVSLTCDGEEKPPQILANDVIFYPNWSCQKTGEITHLVNIARKHTLEFQFGNKIAYAYNNPDSVTDTFNNETYIDSKSNITVDTGAGTVKLSTCSDYGTACGGAGECCSNKCINDVCCDSDCTGLCKTCSGNDGGTAGTCHNTADNYDLDFECAGPSYDACSNQYTRIGPDGFCDGAGVCDTNDASTYVSAGDVCYQGSSTDPSGNTNCGTGAQNCYCDNDWYQCDATNDCTYDQYYVGFNNGASCIQTGAVERTANATNPAGYRCNAGSATVYESYTSIMDTNECDTADYCNGTCAYYTGKICSGGTCSQGNGSTNCSSGTYCPSTSCISGYCATCKDCSGGSCGNVAECENCYGCTGSCFWCSGSGTCYKKCEWIYSTYQTSKAVSGSQIRCKPSIGGTPRYSTTNGSAKGCTVNLYESWVAGSNPVYVYNCSCTPQ